MIVIHHLDGRKTLRMIFLHKGYLQNDDSMLVQLTTGLPQDCIEPEGALVIVQQSEGNPYEEGSSSSVIPESDEVQVSHHTRNFSIA